ncbi:MAG TPA: polysaccharide biosynthesis/export family protein [Candidatus Eisenbacteria bacterium]|nr:polysaccharide biosynthesis/export family protein [Candidatus Eisenbacteria bacterium]
MAGYLLGWIMLLAMPAAASAATAPRIQAGDVIRVDVASRADLSGEFVVAADGNVTLPTAGPVRAAGRTEADLGADLSRRYSLIDREIPRVTVTITRSSQRRVLVLGAVVLPGAYDYSDSSSPWDAIALAGGAQEDANLAAVEIIPGEGSHDRKQETIDVQSAILAGTLEKLPRLHPGDTVRVQRKSGAAGSGSVVYIFGAVAQQGPKPLEEAYDVASALILALPTPDANLGQVEIVRKNGNQVEHLRVDADRYLTSAYEAGNVPLRAGDTIWLKRSKPRGAVLLAMVGLIAPILALATTIIALRYYDH